MSQSSSSDLLKDLKEKLRDIDSRLRIKLSMDTIALSTRQLFSLIANYPKGD